MAQLTFAELCRDPEKLSPNHQDLRVRLHPEVGGTSNEAERTLRDPALDRRTGKTHVGALRRTILVSVFESLRLYLSEFTLPGVLGEIQG